jgi:SPP1 family predicted phage head-tail adaptor
MITTTAGQLDKYVALQKWVESRTASGHVTKTWGTYYNCWAYIRTLSGLERLRAQQVGTIHSHEITIRHTRDYVIQPDHRIVYVDADIGTRTFDIKDVRNVDEAGWEIRMQCIEIPTEGPSASPSPSASASASPSASVSGSPSTSVSASASASPSASVSASPSEGTPSASVSASPSASVSASVSGSPSSGI